MTKHCPADKCNEIQIHTTVVSEFHEDNEGKNLLENPSKKPKIK